MSLLKTWRNLFLNWVDWGKNDDKFGLRVWAENPTVPVKRLIIFVENHSDIK